MAKTLKRGDIELTDNISAQSAVGDVMPPWARDLLGRIDGRFDRIEHRLAERISEKQLPPFGYVQVKEAAAFVNFKYESVRRWADAGKITASKIGGNWYVAIKPLVTYVEKKRAKNKRKTSGTSNR